MDILHRVAKAAKETGDLRSQDPEAVARTAIATVLNWLGDPPQPAVDAAVFASHTDAATARRVWTALVAEMRKEAGF